MGKQGKYLSRFGFYLITCIGLGLISAAALMAISQSPLTFLSIDQFGRSFNLTPLKTDITPNISCSHIGKSAPCVYLLDKQGKYSLGDSIHIGIVSETVPREGSDRNDFLLVSMRDENHGAASAGSVNYVGRGMYIATLRALWVGQSRISVIVRGTFHGLDIINATLRTHDIGEKFRCIFRCNQHEESTRAFLVLKQGEYSESKYCNLTNENYGYALYCLRPTKRELQCTDWTQTYHDGWFTTKDKRFGSNFEREITARKLSMDVKIQITSKGESLIRPSSTCDRRHFDETWSASSPIGFFFNNTWHSTLCNSIVTTDNNRVKKCLTNRSVRFFGDSVVRQLYLDLMKRIPVTLLTEKIPPNGITHRPIRCVSRELNLTLYWGLHGLPLTYEKFYRGASRPIHTHLDLIPSSSKDIILFSIFLHFGLQNPVLFRRHMIRIAESAKALLKRSPDVKIGVMAPHSLLGSNERERAVGMVGYIYRGVIKEVFRELRKKMFFIDYFEMTAAVQNQLGHPHNYVVRAVADHFLMLACTK